MSAGGLDNPDADSKHHPESFRGGGAMEEEDRELKGIRVNIRRETASGETYTVEL